MDRAISPLREAARYFAMNSIWILTVHDGAWKRDAMITEMKLSGGRCGAYEGEEREREREVERAKGDVGRSFNQDDWNFV